jgi:uncharacterized membrane protein
VSRAILGPTFIATRLAHFVRPRRYELAVNKQFPKPLLWARLPRQGALVAWVWRTTAP